VTWVAPEITRVMRPLAEPAGDKRTVADAWLDFHRQTLLRKCGGLTLTGPRPPPLPGWTCSDRTTADVSRRPYATSPAIATRQLRADYPG
jgi:hypothetical protein